MRDLTKKQFEEACAQHGFTRVPYMGGYWYIGDFGGGKLQVYAPNAGNRRRDQLAYLIKMVEKHSK